MVPPQHHTIWDLPLVWVAVLVDFFGKFPWPGFAAFLASLYTLCRLIGMARCWLRERDDK